MRLGFDARILAHPYNGISTYLLNLIHGFQRKGITEIFLFTDKPVFEGYEGGIQGTQKIVFGQQMRKNWARWLLPFHLAKNKIDLYHATWNIGVPFWSPCPVVVTIYDLFPLLFPSSDFGKQWKYQWNLFIDLSRANRVIAISEATKKDLQRCLKVPERKIRMVPLGISSQISKSGPSGRPYLEETYFVSILGRLAEKRKNTLKLIQAFRKFREIYPQVQLVIIGTGTVEGIELASGIRILEKVSNERLFDLIRGAYLMIHPTLYEGFGLPVLEAMACGVPVVASEAGAIPEVAGSAAMLINPLDVESLTAAMMRLMQDHSLRNRLIQLGKKRAMQYNWDRTVEETVSIYQELIKDGARK